MLKIYLTIFLLISSGLSSEIVQKLEVEGNTRISQETIKVYGNINLGNDYSEFEIIARQF